MIDGERVLRLYLTGAMRGIPRMNFEAFEMWSRVLRDKGYEVFSPAEHDEELYGVGIADHEKDINIRQVMCDDVQWICRNADIVAVIPGWEKSTGVKAEIALAEAIGIEVMYLDKSS